MDSNKHHDLAANRFQVVRFFKSGRRRILERKLTREEAQRCAMRHESTKSSFVGFSEFIS